MRENLIVRTKEKVGDALYADKDFKVGDIVLAKEICFGKRGIKIAAVPSPVLFMTSKSLVAPIPSCRCTATSAR